MDASKIIDDKLDSLADWRGELIRSLRRIIHEVAPDVIEEWKWMGTATWNRDGILCIANAHKEKVKVTFPKGAKLPDPKHVFNAGLAGGTWRSIDWARGDKINVEGVKGLVRAAVALNGTKPAARKPDAVTSISAKTRVRTAAAKKKPAAAKKPAKSKPRKK